ncbi:hypothetical protein HYPSUDRAFT_209128 [Hypholoma sublateritium FD-334 SS-4]|uniref:Uncharacterized protein n=1 Tax=Hypholoma sublateritium (strain FD-334 SS-4) TaxID=945553 RepID=A0A0D2N3X2_HYPSF|nr:hypothetical protein HYPSUDRAFT_209128 [Hypholoma sublateritium FD-334 SS-4]
MVDELKDGGDRVQALAATENIEMPLIFSAMCRSGADEACSISVWRKNADTTSTGKKSAKATAQAQISMWALVLKTPSDQQQSMLSYALSHPDGPWCGVHPRLPPALMKICMSLAIHNMRTSASTPPSPHALNTNNTNPPRTPTLRRRIILHGARARTTPSHAALDTLAHRSWPPRTQPAPVTRWNTETAHWITAVQSRAVHAPWALCQSAVSGKYSKRGTAVLAAVVCPPSSRGAPHYCAECCAPAIAYVLGAHVLGEGAHPGRYFAELAGQPRRHWGPRRRGGVYRTGFALSRSLLGGEEAREGLWPQFSAVQTRRGSAWWAEWTQRPHRHRAGGAALRGVSGTKVGASCPCRHRGDACDALVVVVVMRASEGA